MTMRFDKCGSYKIIIITQIKLLFFNYIYGQLEYNVKNNVCWQIIFKLIKLCHHHGVWGSSYINQHTECDETRRLGLFKAAIINSFIPSMDDMTTHRGLASNSVVLSSVLRNILAFSCSTSWFSDLQLYCFGQGFLKSVIVGAERNSAYIMTSY